MSQNWMRHFELQLVGKKGEGISLSDLKVTFDIEWFNLKYPSVATITIYNLSQTTTNRIMGKEFSQVRIIAGYDGIAPSVTADQEGVARRVDPGTMGQRNGQNFSQIYSGDIRFSSNGKINGTDSWVKIQVCDGFEAYIKATISSTLAKGYTVEDIYNQLIRCLAPFGIVAGRKPRFPPTVFPRGRTFHGMVRDYLDVVAQQCGATWQLVNGRLDMMTPEMVRHDVIVLNSRTGLVGMPSQTIGAGVDVRCLINPNIRVNGLIQLDQASVNRAALSTSDIQTAGGRITTVDVNGNQTVQGTVSQPASIATDGVYVVRSIRYTGDTRGTPWYMDLMCEARGAADLTTQAARERGLL